MLAFAGGGGSCDEANTAVAAVAGLYSNVHCP
jgi:hypothetical protein